jgi:Sulfotransferase domain
VGAHIALLRLILTDWTSGDWQNRVKLREGFVKHYEHVRSTVPEENLIEHRPTDGWEPLCKFLGKPIPDVPYPRVNEGDSAANLHFKVFWIVVAKLVLKRIIMPVGAAVAAMWLYRWLVLDS